MRRMRPALALVFGVASLASGFGFLMAPGAILKLVCGVLSAVAGVAAFWYLDYF